MRNIHVPKQILTISSFNRAKKIFSQDYYKIHENIATKTGRHLENLRAKLEYDARKKNRMSNKNSDTMIPFHLWKSYTANQIRLHKLLPQWNTIFISTVYGA